MAKNMRVVLAQLNVMVGDIQGNTNKYIEAANRARDEMEADVIVFPELGVTGYPVEDLLLRAAFIQQEQLALKKLINSISGIHCVISHSKPYGKKLYNACSVSYNGEIIGHYEKQHLPNYGVFDEERYFLRGSKSCVVTINGIRTGIVVCEDLWEQRPVHQAVHDGARVILAPNASPFEVTKHDQRLTVLSTLAKHNHVPIAYVNNVGGQDELIFDGGSMVVDENGHVAQCAGFFAETLLPVDITVNATNTTVSSKPFQLPSDAEKIYRALVLATRDYFEKNKLPGAIIGLSGGIDSALTLAIAVDALGKDRVRAVIMPSRYTADISIEDANKMAANVDIHCDTISIEPSYQAILETMQPLFVGTSTDVTEENIQARCRGIILMALSNKTGWLVLTTGNRSEIAVGYCTLYGDMAGGFAPLKDIPKTLVYQLANYRNEISNIIPERIIQRAPTAELAPNQKDEDSLPPYEILDGILERYLNQEKSIADIIADGFDASIVRRVVKLIRISEHKRKQSALGPRINKKSFGKDWRYPVTNGFNE